MARRNADLDASFTRPADTTAYASNDVIGTSSTGVMSFTSAAQQTGWGGRITGVTVVKSTVGVTNLDFDLFIFDTAPAAIADNSAFAPTDAEMLRLVGFVEFLSTDSGVGTVNVAWTKTNLDLAYICQTADVTLYGVLVARGAHTPSSADVWKVRLKVEMD